LVNTHLFYQFLSLNTFNITILFENENRFERLII